MLLKGIVTLGWKMARRARPLAVVEGLEGLGGRGRGAPSSLDIEAPELGAEVIQTLAISNQAPVTIDINQRTLSIGALCLREYLSQICCTFTSATYLCGIPSIGVNRPVLTKIALGFQRQHVTFL